MRQIVIWEEIRIERDRQDKKWGVAHSRDHTHLYWLAILVEEVGEVGKAIWERASKRVEGTQSIKKELIQCAAVIVAWLEDRFND